MAETKRWDALPLAPPDFSIGALDEALERKKEIRRAGAALRTLQKIAKGLVVPLAILIILLQGVALDTMQNRLTGMGYEIHNLRRSNELLTVSVLKAQNLDQVKETAKSDAYISRSAATPRIVDLTQDNFLPPKASPVKKSLWAQFLTLFQ
ncbi:hypothetical protein ABB02_02005 [Clostridiaceae bacterium JG1575]|nr:hypothetical protein ABB02_02005 [Clostridiaceae bacterium JG1575]